MNVFFLATFFLLAFLAADLFLLTFFATAFLREAGAFFRFLLAAFLAAIVDSCRNEKRRGLYMAYASLEAHFFG